MSKKTKKINDTYKTVLIRLTTKKDVELYKKFLLQLKQENLGKKRVNKKTVNELFKKAIINVMSKKIIRDNEEAVANLIYPSIDKAIRRYMAMYTEFNTQLNIKQYKNAEQQRELLSKLLVFISRTLLSLNNKTQDYIDNPFKNEELFNVPNWILSEFNSDEDDEDNK